MANKVVQLVDENNDNLYPLSSDPNAAHITMTTTDPGEGTALGQNEFVAVYGGSTKVGTSDIVDGAVTSQKIDWATINNSYSTSEVDTHMKWIDGRTIYKKTIEWGAMPNATRVNKTGQFPNNATIINIEAIAMTATAAHNMQYVYDALVDSVFVGNTANGQLSISTTTDRSTWNAYITLYYCKAPS